jgi:ATP-binding cassette subfamily F protein 3
VGKSYGQRRVLSDLDLCIDAGERLVVAGPNGAGKTTLLRIIAGVDNKFDGKVKYGSGICAGYFSQDAAEAMEGSQSIIEFMEEQAPTALIPKLRDMLGAFLFRGDDVYKSVSVLSGGEKSRLALLQMFLKPMNLLILDEPTNHLDLYSKDILLDALNKFTGTIIFVSHDRSFMEALSTKTLELAPGTDASPAQARLFYGNYAYYLERKGAQGQPETAAQSVTPKSSLEKRVIDKQKQALVRRLQKREEDALRALETLENEKAALEAELARPDVYSNGEKAREVKQKIDENTAASDKKTREWEAVAAELEGARAAQ